MYGIGGSDAKDYITRILKFLLSNSLGEMCSWTGRKNNYPIQSHKWVEITYGEYQLFMVLFINTIQILVTLQKYFCVWNIDRTCGVSNFLGVVHSKCRATSKDFEVVVKEWLRHSKQRRLRENIRT